MEWESLFLFSGVQSKPAPPVTIYIRVMPPMFRIPRAVWMSQSVGCGGRLFWRRESLFFFPGVQRVPAPPVTIFIRVMPPMFRIPRRMCLAQRAGILHSE
jgi:hypothetical protein